jgi:hypothetical protein
MNNLELLASRSRSFFATTTAPVIFFALSLASTTAATPGAASDVEGRWSGKVQIPGNELILIVDLARKPNWMGSATLPALNVMGAQLTGIEIQGASVSFGIQAMTGPSVEPPKIKAQLTDKKLIGDFLQAGNSARVVLEKIGPPQVEEPLRSTPVAKEFEGEWRGEYQLFGYERKVTLKLQNRDSQPASAEFVIVGRKVNNVPVDRIVQQGSFITIDSSAFGLTYEGRFQNGAIQGTVLQGPIAVALVLHRPM